MTLLITALITVVITRGRLRESRGIITSHMPVTLCVRLVAQSTTCLLLWLHTAMQLYLSISRGVVGALCRFLSLMHAVATFD